ncbi:hypothetical protein Scep_024393 [Stephania cephalantha]|uniref:Uncharacterized protein n=1 Tax=Stephania cephalantha TaxID=152367 RepID=A0AAP0HTM9_9MAGN
MRSRILQVWRDHQDVYDASRATNCLQCRWAKIVSAINKFHAVYERLERSPKSGTTPEDMMRETRCMYEDLNNRSSFKYEHCWELLHHFQVQEMNLLIDLLL